eukprot:357202-Chlamydomonas_euryale.AAC.11
MGAENFRAINLATCDSVIIGVPSELGYPDSDALVLSALLQIQKLAAECERMFGWCWGVPRVLVPSPAVATPLQVHVVFKASSPNTKEVALQFLHSLTKCYVSVEVVLTSQLTSAILTQALTWALFPAPLGFSAPGLPTQSIYKLTVHPVLNVLWQPSVIDLVVELMVYAEGNELYLLEPDQLGLQRGVGGRAEGRRRAFLVISPSVQLATTVVLRRCARHVSMQLCMQRFVSPMPGGLSSLTFLASAQCMMFMHPHGLKGLLWPEATFMGVGESVSFGEMVEAGKLLEMSVLGLVRHDKAQISLDGRDLVIAPPCDEVLDLHHGDKIVVIADLV